MTPIQKPMTWWLFFASLFALVVFVGLRRPEPAPAEMGGSAPPTRPDVSPPSVPSQPLPAQELKGVRAEVTLRTTQPPWRHTHTLDLRLTNTEAAAKQNVTIEKVSLGQYPTDFERPPAATLWHRGSSWDYPAVASWSLPWPTAANLPLDVTVRYERENAGVPVTFHWIVWVETVRPVNGVKTDTGTR